MAVFSSDLLSGLLLTTKTMDDKMSSLLILVSVICAVAFILVQVVLVYFVIKYRRKKGEVDRKTPFITHNAVLETIWTIVPTILMMVIFYFGMVNFKELRAIPEDALTIEVTGRQWSWDYTYRQVEPAKSLNTTNLCKTPANYNGPKLETPTDCRNAKFEWSYGDPLRVPVNTKIALKMTSVDVLHSFYLPQFMGGAKQDVVPKQYSYLWFIADKVGTYDVYCTEYCGTNHSGMVGKVEVMTQEDFSRWLAGGEGADTSGKVLSDKELTELGRGLVNSKGCIGCHSLTGEKRVTAPALNKIFGKQEVLDDDKSVLVDENYLLESILEPGAKVVKGFSAMPIQNVSPEEAKAIIQFIKSMK